MRLTISGCLQNFFVTSFFHVFYTNTWYQYTQIYTRWNKERNTPQRISLSTVKKGLQYLVSFKYAFNMCKQKSSDYKTGYISGSCIILVLLFHIHVSWQILH